MLSRFVSKSLHLRLLTSISSQSQFHLQSNPNKFPQSSHPSPFRPIPNPSLGYFKFIPRHFSTDRSNNNNDNGSGVWNFSSETEDSLFGEETGNLEGTEIESESSFSLSESDSSKGNDEGADMFKRIDKTRIENEPTWVSELESKGNDNGDNIFSKALGGIGKTDHWATADGYEEDWGMAGEDRKPEVLYTFGGDSVELKSERSEDDKQLEREEKELSSVLQGPNRAFGDLVAVSGITESMLDSLMALKDFEGVDGLPPLSMIEDMRYEKNTRKSTRAEIERQKQEEVAKARVRQVDSKGRAYGTGKRKCSIARVWIQPGEGKFVINDKQFDVYFPMLDQRAALLRPFSETKTLGLWDVSCTVKGGGVSGQVGAVRLGISRALQNWEPALRPPLREAGFLTRDSRVVERKKPGKAKARKSFQWVKR